MISTRKPALSKRRSYVVDRELGFDTYRRVCKEAREYHSMPTRQWTPTWSKSSASNIFVQGNYILSEHFTEIRNLHGDLVCTCLPVTGLAVSALISEAPYSLPRPSVICYLTKRGFFEIYNFLTGVQLACLRLAKGAEAENTIGTFMYMQWNVYGRSLTLRTTLVQKTLTLALFELYPEIKLVAKFRIATPVFAQCMGEPKLVVSSASVTEDMLVVMTSDHRSWFFGLQEFLSMNDKSGDHDPYSLLEGQRALPDTHTITRFPAPLKVIKSHGHRGLEFNGPNFEYVTCVKPTEFQVHNLDDTPVVNGKVSWRESELDEDGQLDFYDSNNRLELAGPQGVRVFAFSKDTQGNASLRPLFEMQPSRPETTTIHTADLLRPVCAAPVYPTSMIKMEEELPVRAVPLPPVPVVAAPAVPNRRNQTVGRRRRRRNSDESEEDEEFSVAPAPTVTAEAEPVRRSRRAVRARVTTAVNDQQDGEGSETTAIGERAARPTNLGLSQYFEASSFDYETEYRIVGTANGLYTYDNLTGQLVRHTATPTFSSGQKCTLALDRTTLVVLSASDSGGKSHCQVYELR